MPEAYDGKTLRCATTVKVSRLRVDGRGKAGGRMVRAAGFSTCCELSDLAFKDITSVPFNLGSAEAQGQAEHRALRSLEQLRAVRINPPMDRPKGVTDVKLYRVLVTGGDGKDTVRIQAGDAPR